MNNIRKNNTFIFISSINFVDHGPGSSKKALKSTPVDASHFNTENIITCVIGKSSEKKRYLVNRIFWLIKNYSGIDLCFNTYWLESLQKYTLRAFFYLSKWHANIF